MTFALLVGMPHVSVAPEKGECHVCGATEVTSIEASMAGVRVACRACSAERLLEWPPPFPLAHRSAN